MLENLANSMEAEFRTCENLANSMEAEFRAAASKTLQENLANIAGSNSGASKTWEISWDSNVNAMQWKCIEVQCTESGI